MRSEPAVVAATTPGPQASDLPEPELLGVALAGSREATEAYRKHLRAARQTLGESIFAGRAPGAVLRRMAHLVDLVTLRAFAHHVQAMDAPIALVAVGGYGRGELLPGSDVDLLLLLEQEPSADDVHRIHNFLAFLWDIGLEVGHSTRTVEECAARAAGDATIVTNLMESRLLGGAREPFLALRARIGPDRMWPSAAYFAAKLEEQAARHRRFDDALYNLEPNVKDGPGGLRDLQTIVWVLHRHYGAGTFLELVNRGLLAAAEYATLAEGQDFLWQVRCALHVLAGRREDRLLFDHQRTLAARFGYTDDERQLGVEKLMKRYYRTIMELRRLDEMLLEVFQESITPEVPSHPPQPIDRDFQSVNGYLEARSDALFHNRPAALMEMFLVLQRHPELHGVRASAMRQVRTHRLLIDERFRRDPEVRHAFLAILRQPRWVTRELRRMHRYGVLAAYLPAFEAVVGQMQYDLFHTYTVDEHSLFVLRNVRSFSVPERRTEFPLCAEIFARLQKPELLYIAALYHDIGKGSGADHSEVGSALVRTFCSDHGIGPYDTNLAAWLVRHHLLMSMTAQRRDITDPEVINAFAHTVGDQTHLDYLYLLTVADIRGTNPRLWNDWKATLLADLYHGTSRALRRGLENPIDRGELIAETRAAALPALEGEYEPHRIAALWNRLGEDYFLHTTPEEIAWHTRGILAHPAGAPPLVLLRDGRGGSEIFVYASDQKYLFAATTTALGRLGLNILSARIITAENGMTLDSYVVSEADGGWVTEPDRRAEITRELRAILLHPGDSPREVNQRAGRKLRHFAIPTQVDFLRDPSDTRTVMEVIARDRPGLLARIGWAMAECGARLHNARITTLGERAEDVFYLTGPDNAPLEGASLARLEESVRRHIDGG